MIILLQKNLLLNILSGFFIIKMIYGGSKSKNIAIGVIILLVILVLIAAYLWFINPDIVYRNISSTNPYAYLMYSSTKLPTASPTGAVTPSSISDILNIPTQFVAITSTAATAAADGTVSIFQPATTGKSATAAKVVTLIDPLVTTTQTPVYALACEYAYSSKLLYFMNVSDKTLHSIDIAGKTNTKLTTTMTISEMAFSSDGTYVAILTTKGLILTSIDNLGTNSGSNTVAIDDSITLVSLTFSDTNVLYGIDSTGIIYILVEDISGNKAAIKPLAITGTNAGYSVIAYDKSNADLYAMIPAASATKSPTISLVTGLDAAIKVAVTANASITDKTKLAIVSTGIADSTNLTTGWTSIEFCGGTPMSAT